MSRVSKIKGFQDILSPEVEKYNHLEQTAKNVFELYGYSEIRTPVLERTELFARSIGSDTDIVQKEMFTFADKKERSLSMRPEATAGVVRAYIENRLYSQGQVSKLYTFGPMFRYERPQKGRQRQFYQINAEMFGADSPMADAEIIMMLMGFLQQAGLMNLRLELNSLGCSKCRGEFYKALKDYLQGLEQKKLCPDCQERSKRNPLRVLDCKVPTCQELIQKAPVVLDYICSDCKRHFQRVTEVLKQAGFDFVLNHRLVRGLDYYQRTTFEVVSEDIGAQAAVAGGGRYDGLVSLLGGQDVSGIGFACGMERLVMILDKLQDRQEDFYIAVLEEEGLAKAQLMAQNLRKAGYSGQVSFEAKSLKSQLRQANKNRVRKCLIIGSDELDRGEVQVKDMQEGSGQLRISTEDVLSAFD